MRLKTILTATITLFFASAALAGAAQPRPLANPDRPATTPRMEAGATVSANRICPALRRLARAGNRRPGLRVKNLKSGKTVCGLNSTGKRVLASNTKIFTTTTALARLGPQHRFSTRIFADGSVTAKGELQGSLYLVGGGDPTLGTKDFLDTYLAGEGASIERLADQVKRAGITSVTGRLWGDDTVFDRVRGVADSGFATSSYIGPLSGLSFNAGFTSATLSRFSSNPAKLATKTLVRELRKRGIEIRKEIAMGPVPKAARAQLIGRQRSPDMVWMARLTNLYSNNFFAETLLKDIGAGVRGTGSTEAGTKVTERYAASLGAKIDQVDGSGLSVGNRSTAAAVVKVLSRVRRQEFGDAFIASLPVAGRDGTLANRMRGSAAEGNCHAKTGTLTGVSALSGYCFNSSGRKFAFSVLMNNVYDLNRAHIGQDKIAALIARL